MFDKKDYTQLSLEALLTEEKKMKRNEILSAVLIGFLIGVMIYGLVKKGFGLLHMFLPIFLILGIQKNAQIQKQSLREIQAEINSRNEKL
jgi:uncharacterized membrane protein YoaK (UPF0700 family)